VLAENLTQSRFNVLDTEDARHLLVRTGIGSSVGDVLSYTGMRRIDAVEALVAGMQTQPGIPMPEFTRRPVPHYHLRGQLGDDFRVQFNRQRNQEITRLRQWWVLNMLETTSPQTERLVLFWHDLFATNYRNTNRQSLAMARQNQTFRQLGFGSWEQLLKQMIRDAALLDFLDANSNHRKSPNENLARELLELFTLGEGAYSEATVREAARSLTGYSTHLFHNLEFRLRTGVQDRDEKILFGQRGSFDADDLVEIILQQPAAARFLATRFWHAFVADTEPETDWLDWQAEQFRRSDYDISELYRHVLLSDAFWDERYRAAMVKSPVDLLVGTARTLEYPKHQWRKMPRQLARLGMNLFAPPDVSGWSEGAGFISAGRLLERYKAVRKLLRGGSVPSEPFMKAVEDESAANLKALEDWQASAVYLKGASKNDERDVVTVTIVLNDLRTSDRQFSNVAFALRAEPNLPLQLKMGSYDCWPDCFESMPECAWVDRHFPPSKMLTLPWLNAKENGWQSEGVYGCQFSSLTDHGRRLIASMWASAPELITHLLTTQRGRRFSSELLAMQERLAQRNMELVQTPYAQWATVVQLEPGMLGQQSLMADSFDVQHSTLEQWVDELDRHSLAMEQVLLADVEIEGVPAMEQTRSGKALKRLRQTVEHPLFQLK